MRVRLGLISLKRRVPGLPGTGSVSCCKSVHGGSALCLEQRLMNGLNVAETMDLKAPDFKQRHSCECAHLFAVTEDAFLDGLLRG